MIFLFRRELDVSCFLSLHFISAILQLCGAHLQEILDGRICQKGQGIFLCCPGLAVQLLFQHAILSANGQGRIFYFIQIHHLLLNNANKFYFIKELLRLGENDFGTVRE